MSDTPDLIGNRGAVLQPSDYTDTPLEGRRTTIRVRGEKSAVDSELLLRRSQGASVAYQEEAGPYASGEYAFDPNASQPSDQELYVQWTLDGGEAERAIWEHPNTVLMLEEWKAWVETQTGNTAILPAWPADPNISANDWAEDVVNLWRADLVAFGRGTKAITDTEADDNRMAFMDWYKMAIVLTNSATLLPLLLKDLRNSVEAFPVSSYVLRKVQVVHSLFSSSADVRGVNQPVTPAHLLEMEPKFDQFLIGELSRLAGYWFKQTPTTTQTGIYKWQINTDWLWAEDYSRFLYTEFDPSPDP